MISDGHDIQKKEIHHGFPQGLVRQLDEETLPVNVTVTSIC